MALIGRPNAGKSTLLNALIGEKVSAISHRPQTTQRSIPGIFTDEEKGVQIVFLDTPGIHESEESMNHRINNEAFASLREADVVVRLLDPTRPYGDEDRRIDTVLASVPKPILRIETKQDLPKGYLQKDIDLRIDSVARIGFEELIAKITELLPEGPYLYESDYYTDQPMDLRISEIVREVLFRELGDEIPYASYVEIGSIEKGESLLKTQVYINVESDSQKIIVIGK